MTSLSQIGRGYYSPIVTDADKNPLPLVTYRALLAPCKSQSQVSPSLTKPLFLRLPQISAAEGTLNVSERNLHSQVPRSVVDVRKWKPPAPPSCHYHRHNQQSNRHLIDLRPCDSSGLVHMRLSLEPPVAKIDPVPSIHRVGFIAALRQ